MRPAVWCLMFCEAVACLFGPLSSAQGLASTDLSRFRSVANVALSPDGHRIAYTVVMRDRSGRPFGQLWLRDLATQIGVNLFGNGSALDQVRHR